MTTIKLANGYTIVTEVKDVVIHDRVGFLDLIKTEQRRVAQVWNADGAYEHGMCMPFVKLDMDEATAVAQVSALLDRLIEYYRESESEYQRMLGNIKEQHGKDDY